MKKIFSILLLCCLLIYIGGYHLVYAVYQNGIKQEMKAYLQTHTDDRYGTYFSFQLDSNGVNDPAFNWEEVNEEFSYHGEKYDVVTLQHSPHSLRICAIKDERENNLEKQLSAIHHNTHNSSSTAPVSFIKIFSAFYMANTGPQFFSQAPAIQYLPGCDENFASRNHEVNTPPPKC